MSDETVSKLLDAQDLERRAIARRLHDVVGHSMSRVLLELELLDAQEDQRAVLSNIQARIGEVVEDMGSLARELSGPACRDAELSEVFHSYARDFERAFGLPVRVVAREPLPRAWPEPVMHAALRAVRATLMQCALPAGARHASVSIDVQGAPQLQLSVAFEASHGAPPVLSTLREIVWASGGTVHATVEAGITVIALRLPWHGSDAPDQGRTQAGALDGGKAP